MSTEIPLVLPGIEGSPRRYAVDEDCHIRRVPASAVRDAASGSSPFERQDKYDASSEDALMGAASVSTLNLRQKDVILTTSALPDDPHVLSLALSWTSDPMESPKLIQLDLTNIIASGQLSDAIAKVHAFAEDTAAGLAIRVVIVDTRGTFLVFRCTDQLMPHPAPAKILAVSDYMPSTAATNEVSEQVANSTLQPNMVTFVTRSYVCVALAPFIFSVDIDKATSAIWSESHCLEGMQSSVFKILTRTSEAIIGKVEGSVLDMPPVAAMCLASRPNPLLDPYFLFTVHSDASIRKWTLQPEAGLSPHEVYKLELDQASVPRPSEWSGRPNSVALSSRLYSQAYALVLHVQVHQSYFDVGQSTPAASTCHLVVMEGQQQNSAEAKCLSLQVPNTATSLVSMSFLPATSRCTLATLYRSKTGIIDATYPPSFMTMVGITPTINCCEGSLDMAAAEETRRVKALSFMPDDIGTDLHSGLQSIDAMYMKYLFRPIYPRGTGTVLPPSRNCIRASMAKLVRGYNTTQPYSETYSVELETMRAMEDWRTKEQSAQPLGTPMKAIMPVADAAQGILTSPQQVYQSMVDCSGDDDGRGDDDDDHDMNIDDMDDDDIEARIEKNQQKLHEHDSRWRQFLLQVLEEEEALRHPLLSGWAESQNTNIQIVVRSGVTTTLVQPPHTQDQTSVDNLEKEKWNILDRSALSLLSAVEQDGGKSIDLSRLEQDICRMTSAGTLALVTPDTIDPMLSNFKNLASWAWTDSGSNGISDEEHGMLEVIGESISVEELMNWAVSTPDPSSMHLPGLSVASADVEGRQDERKLGRMVMASSQLRHCACSLAKLCADSMRRMYLGRWLLLSDLIQGGDAEVVARRAYFQSVAVLWTTSQHVPMPDAAYHTTRRKTVNFDGSPDGFAPPGKRLSFGDDAQSLLPVTNAKVTTALDVVMMASSQRMDATTFVTNSPAEVTMLLGFAFVHSAFASQRVNISFAASPAHDDGEQQLELGALPTPKDMDVVTDYPRLALRLLAPYVSFHMEHESTDHVSRRNETAAECMLIESHAWFKQGGQDEDAILQLRERASALLISNGFGHPTIDPDTTGLAIEALQSVRRKSATPMMKDWQKQLSGMLRNLAMSDGTAPAGFDFDRVAKLESVKNWFLPSIAAGNARFQEEEVAAAIQELAALLVHLTQLMHRITVVSRHIGSPTRKESNYTQQGSAMVIQLINGTISTFQDSIPSEECLAMPEYINLWSSLFQHSVNARDWDQAFEACVKNPDEGRRDADFRQLVRDMVDRGALQELLAACQKIGSGDGEDGESSHDLYQIASTVLEKLALGSENFYTLRATSQEPFRISDYAGALFSLHTSQRQWRRAAQSMDVRYVTAVGAMKSGGYTAAHSLGASILRDTIIVEDLTMASLGAWVSFGLVKDKGTKYFVSGGSDSDDIVSTSQSNDATMLQMSNKRSRGTAGPSAAVVEDDDDEDDGNDRETGKIDLLMTPAEVHGRVILSLALRTLFMDKSVDPLVAKSGFMSEIHETLDIVKKLFDLGYYPVALLLAKTVANNYRQTTGACGSGGEDILSNAIRTLLEAHIVPIAIGVAASQSDNEESEGETSDKRIWTTSRPTLRQIQNTASYFDKGPTFSFIRAEQYKSCSLHTQTLIEKNAMAVLEKVVNFQAVQDKLIAADVANAIFVSSINEFGSPAQLPMWLETCLGGERFAKRGGFACSGANAHNNTSFRGDPSALLTLYMKYGLFAEACELVTSVLSSTHTLQGRTRLPEKGDVLFVPLKKIDTLWNLIEIVLRKNLMADNLSKQSLIAARRSMESAIEKYHAMLKMTDMGQTSARTLHRVG